MLPFPSIRIIVKKSLVYMVLIASITSIYAISILTFERLFQNVLGYQTMLGSIITTLMIAVIFTPLQHKIQRFVDKRFFKQTAIEMAEENEMLRQEVAQSDRYKTLVGLTSGIVDEIKNPLTALKGYAHFLEQKFEDKEFLEKFEKVHETEIQKIDNLVERLIHYSNPAPPATQKMAILKLLDETLDMLKSNLIEQKIDLTKEYKASDHLQLDVDPDQLRQALSNIIVNAVEAMPGGGRLWIGAEETPDNFRITIKDSGRGIAEEDLMRIFDPFFSRKEKTGLGLAITQGIIENHQGKIKAKSEPGSGAEFIIELPLV